MSWACLRAMIVLAVLSAVSAGPARAEVRVEGSVRAATIEATDASVDDVLAALHDRFGVSYRGPSNPTRRITGTFEGPLTRILPRMLSGYDFVIRNNGGTLDIDVLSAGTSRQAIPSPTIRRRQD
jgi:hypothetical protein